MEVGDFYFAKVLQTHMEDGYKIGCGCYKIRPVLIIGEKHGWYECLTLTTQLKNNLQRKNRIDVYTNYDLPKHSQIICGYTCIVNRKNFRDKISSCRPDDFECIINKHKKMLEINYCKDGKR